MQNYAFDYPKLEAKVIEFTGKFVFEQHEFDHAQLALADARRAAQMGYGIDYFKARELIFDLLDCVASDATNNYSAELCYNCKAYRRDNCDHNHYAINN